MLRSLLYASSSSALRVSGWIQDGRRYDAPAQPDRLLRIDPARVERKPVTKPQTGTVPPTVVAGGDWDLELEPVENDVVHRVFRKRFVEGTPWEETGYVEFLQSAVSEHGTRSPSEALERCERLDELYEYVETNGFRTQRELERNGSTIDGLSGSIRPPAYREIAVDVTRDGEFVWHAGMHRLVIAQLLEIEEIPVRVNTRHEKWQSIRDAALRGENTEFDDHPDVEYLVR